MFTHSYTLWSLTHKSDKDMLFPPPPGDQGLTNVTSTKDWGIVIAYGGDSGFRATGALLKLVVLELIERLKEVDGGRKNMVWAWILLMFVGLTEAKRGQRIDIYKQAGGDITQLRRSTIPNVMYNALPSTSNYRWTLYRDESNNYIMPYAITGSFDSEEQQTIRDAMTAIANNTCIRFEPRKSEPYYLDLQNENGQGCYTTVGRQLGKNVVMLEANDVATCVEHDIVVHELMHAIGLWHEHMRSDRDEFIKVHYENIDTTYHSQFNKIPDNESTTYGVRYDYRSVMHYAKDAFGTNSRALTMETLDPAYQDIIGHVTDAAPSDYLKICSIYKCSNCMGKPFTADTIAAYERSLRELPTTKSTDTPISGSVISGNGPGSVSSFATLPTLDNSTKLGSTRANRLSTTRNPNGNSNEISQIIDELESTHKTVTDCTDRFFCPTILNAWNKDFMCRMRNVQTWCCLTCAGNSHQSVWYRFGVAD
uniref:Metalloendopeptidase n=1 Tax=Panagrellus redivivus TaxID=6233 RepID=A0A7E4V078_PANRE